MKQREIDLVDVMTVVMSLFTQDTFDKNDIKYETVDQEDMNSLINDNADLIADHARDIVYGMIVDHKSTLLKLAQDKERP